MCPSSIWKPFGTKFVMDCKKEAIFSWFFMRYYFQLKITFLGDPVPNLEWIDTLYGTYSANSEQMALRNIKELSSVLPSLTVLDELHNIFISFRKFTSRWPGQSTFYPPQKPITIEREFNEKLMNLSWSQTVANLKKSLFPVLGHFYPVLQQGLHSSHHHRFLVRDMLKNKNNFLNEVTRK